MAKREEREGGGGTSEIISRESESRGKRYGSTRFVDVTKFSLMPCEVIGFDCTYIGSLPARRMQPAFLPAACCC